MGTSFECESGVFKMNGSVIGSDQSPVVHCVVSNPLGKQQVWIALEKGTAYKQTSGKVRMSKDGDWSESYMANLFDWHLKEQDQMPWLTGSAQWIFKDFATPLRPENPVPRVNQT